MLGSSGVRLAGRDQQLGGAEHRGAPAGLSRYGSFIKTALGSSSHAEDHLTTAAKARGMSLIRGGAGVASRATSLLGAIYKYGIAQGIVRDSPVRGVTRQADGRKERRLNDSEYIKLGTAFRLAEAEEKIWPAAVGVARFLVLTGWRRGEALGLRWRDVDLASRTVILLDSKTGRSMRALPQAACTVLTQAGRGLDSARVFPPARGEVLSMKKPWAALMAKGGLPADVTPHVLRHSFVSLASDLQLAEPTIAALVGHARHSTTARYAHHADRVLLDAADRIATAILRRMAAPVDSATTMAEG